MEINEVAANWRLWLKEENKHTPLIVSYYSTTLSVGKLL